MNIDAKQTVLWRVDKKNPAPAIIKEAASIIARGGLVAFPTETVYGLGANGLDGKAVDSIFAAKGRPRDNPLILHVSDINMVYRYAGDVSKTALMLMEEFWPGPLSVVLPGSSKVPREVSAGLNSLAFRMPDHSVALALIREAGVPVAAPSANTSGKPSPTTAEHTYQDLKGKIDAILDGGQAGMGVESTVLDLTAEVPVILRPGGVTLEDIKELGCDVVLDSSLVNYEEIVDKPRSPGMKYRHYAPSSPLILIEGVEEQVIQEILKLASAYAAQGKRIGVLCRDGNLGKYPGTMTIAAGTAWDHASVAVELYNALRSFDDTDMDIILAEGVEPVGLGLAVANRLRRAATTIIQAKG